MKVTVSKKAGFCPGVKRAHNFIEDLLSMNDGKRIYTLGTLIHNKIYNDSLKARGVNTVTYEQIKEIAESEQPSVLIIRTHGTTKEIFNELKSLEEKHPNFTLCDMTCPYVKSVQSIAEKNTNEKTVFLLFCDPNHPEAISVLSYANGEKHAFSSLEELQNIEIGSKIPILCSQTTQNLLEFKKNKFFLKKLYTNAIFFDTICNVTEKRQNEAIQIAKGSDAMIVIGGRDSSNTHKLYDLCKQECTRTLWIESVTEKMIIFLLLLL